MSDEVVNRTTGPAFARVPSGVLDSPEFADLSATAIRVYLQLWRYSGGARIFPSRSTIARNARIFAGDGSPDVGQVRRALRRLEASGLVAVTQRAGPSGRSTSNLYELRDPPSFRGYDAKGRPLFAGEAAVVDEADTADGAGSEPAGVQSCAPSGAGSAPPLLFPGGAALRPLDPIRSNNLIRQREPRPSATTPTDPSGEPGEVVRVPLAG